VAQAPKVSSAVAASVVALPAAPAADSGCRVPSLVIESLLESAEPPVSQVVPEQKTPLSDWAAESVCNAPGLPELISELAPFWVVPSLLVSEPTAMQLVAELQAMSLNSAKSPSADEADWAAAGLPPEIVTTSAPLSVAAVGASSSPAA
jgi:hypothetical protein